MFENYSTIQNRIDNLYNTRWFQANAYYPTVLFYTDKFRSNSDFSIDSFLKLHLNSGPVTSTAGTKVSPLEKLTDVPTNMKDYLEKEALLENEGVQASNAVLRQFSTIKDLNNISVPLDRADNALVASKKDSGNKTITLSFLNDDDFKVLRYLQAWQSRWYTNDYQKKALASKDSEEVNKGGNKEGGEGYLGLANCLIALDGSITVTSHLSLFGLLPKSIQMPTEFGPQAASNEVKKINVTCLYSHAILTYQDKDRLGFYYYA